MRTAPNALDTLQLAQMMWHSRLRSARSCRNLNSCLLSSAGDRAVNEVHQATASDNPQLCTAHWLANTPIDIVQISRRRNSGRGALALVDTGPGQHRGILPLGFRSSSEVACCCRMGRSGFSASQADEALPKSSTASALFQVCDSNMRIVSIKSLPSCQTSGVA